MFLTLIQVAAGGAAGASLRWISGIGITRMVGQGFPMAIISVNVLGSVLMGLFVVFAGQRGLTHLSPLVMTGFLGGFTTFSAFSLETVTLIERGELGTAAAYVLLSVVLSVGGLALGVWLARAGLA